MERIPFPANNRRVGAETAMKILDFETNKTLNDVTLYLTQDEATELAAFLNRLVDKPQIHKVFLSQIVGHRLERELTVAIDPGHAEAA